MAAKHKDQPVTERTHKERVTRWRQEQGIKKVAAHLRRTDRRERAGVRQGVALRDPRLQLQALDDRLGKGVGAKRERRRLLKKEMQVSDKKGGQS